MYFVELEVIELLQEEILVMWMLEGLGEGKR